MAVVELSRTARAADPATWRPRFSLTMITYARDTMLREVLAHLRPLLAGRADTEFILIDNNPDALDRSVSLTWLAVVRYVNLRENRRVAAPNEGARPAPGHFLVL